MTSRSSPPSDRTGTSGLAAPAVLGWDIGGVNTKVALVGRGEVVAVRQRPFELQRAPGSLVLVLRELAAAVGADAPAAHAVTMTAELSQMFRTKREGVAFVLDAIQEAFGAAPISIFAVDGRFLTVTAARLDPLSVAAANWSAAAALVAQHFADGLLIDVGTTTTDIIPIAGGLVAARGLTDPARLASGELVYTGAVRTPVEAIVSHVPVAGVSTAVSAEGFALSGDAHLWRGDLAEADYTWPTPDGRPAARSYAGERLARVVCADRELLDETAISDIANAVAAAQVAQIASAIGLVVKRQPMLRTAVVTGLGAFIGEAAARAAGLTCVHLAETLGHGAARCAPAAAVALLLDQGLSSVLNRDVTPAGAQGAVSQASQPPVELVVKLGGSLLEDLTAFASVLATLASELPHQRAVIVPGGGPFADAVRKVDEEMGLGDDEAHWMAILAMDQYAQLIASRLPAATCVTSEAEIRAALEAGLVPVLAPYRWLRAADPLEHSWDVTSDTIAAWVSRMMGARQLVLIKPSGSGGDSVVDAWFGRTVPPEVDVTILRADQTSEIRLAIGARAST
ncbi:MAG TPA: hydantoinase/oxoprolinase family protein [Vicinamibacterales bacterium]|nr:hydantoinase/oxoprolinase family protein [Vicinamibacterales bacterium]